MGELKFSELGLGSRREVSPTVSIKSEAFKRAGVRLSPPGSRVNSERPLFCVKAIRNGLRLLKGYISSRLSPEIYRELTNRGGHDDMHRETVELENIRYPQHEKI